MADDRPADTSTDQLATLQSDYDDFKSTMLARVARKPTGDIEVTMRTTPKEDTLLANGQTVSRTTYAVLWQWAQDQSLTGVGALQFGTGDGSTTFSVPNYAGRFLVGAGTLGADTYAAGSTGGATLKTLLTANMPAHSHTVTVAQDGDHDHAFTTTSDGNHGGHNSGGGVPFPPGSGGGAVAGNSATNDGTHNHSGFTGHQPTHNHSATTASVGTGTGFDARPAYAAINVLIWT